MKKHIIFVLGALFLALVSCDRKVEFEHETFVTFDAVQFSVSEAAGKFSIPVTLYNPVNTEVQFIVSSKDSTTKNGVTIERGEDYEIESPRGGVLTFAPGETSKEIVISLKHDPDTTGAKFFEVNLTSVDESFKVGNLSTATCRVRDKEHPLDHFIGVWTGNAMDYFENTSAYLTVSITEDENDDTYTKLRISDLDPISSIMAKTFRLKGTVTDEEKAKLVITSNQAIGDYSGSNDWYSFYAFSISSGGVYQENALTLTYDKKDETLTFDNAYGTLFTYTDGNQYIGSLYESGIVLTKK